MVSLDSGNKEELCKIINDEFCEELNQCGMFFEHNDFTPEIPKRVFHIVTQNGYLLEALKIYRSLCNYHKKTLYANFYNRNHISGIAKLVELFSLPQFISLVIICPSTIEQCVAEQTGNRLREILEQHTNKNIILITSFDSILVQQLRWNDNILHVVDEPVTFENFTKESQKKLWSKRNVTFQGQRISLAELFASETSEGYEAALTREVLEKLVGNEEIKVGSKMQLSGEPSESYYVKRVLKNAQQDVEEADILGRYEKMVLIEGDAGSGKSVLLARLAEIIKSQNPHAWVIAIRMQEYGKALMECRQKGKNAINLTELLGHREATKLATQFEDFVFRKSKNVVLMLDDVHDAWPDYASFVSNLLAECRDDPHISKVILTSRQHAARQLGEELQIGAFKLQPFTHQELVQFLVAYWTYHLRIEEANKEKCEGYARQLISHVSPRKETSPDRALLRNPLVGMTLAKLFQQSESTEWDGCREYMSVDRSKPTFPEGSATRLIKSFIQTTQTIFIEKTNPNGNRITSHAFGQFYEECLACHQTLALKTVVGEEKLGLFSSRRQVDNSMEAHMLKVGFVRKQNNELSFAHRSVAEYFATEYLLKELFISEQNVKFQKYFLEEFLFDPNFIDVRLFLNGILCRVVDSLSPDMFRQYQSLSGDNDESNDLSLIHVLAAEGCTAILQLILKCIDCPIVRGKDILVEDGKDTVPDPKLGNTLKNLHFLVQRYGVNIHNKHGQTPLHSAAERGRLDTIKFLVERGGDVTAKCHHLLTPLHYAAEGGHLDCVKFLVERGAAVNTNDCDSVTALHSAASGGHMDTVKFLVERGAVTSTKDNWGRTPLCAAASMGHLTTVQFFAEQGADVNIKNRYRERPLHCAAALGYLDIVQFLLERGVNVDINTDYGWTPLFSATERGQRDAVTFLVDRGANVNAKDSDGLTPLHLAAAFGHLDIVKRLLDAGADVEIKCKGGQTPLHSAAEEGHLETVKFLVGRGANVCVKDNDGKTPLHLAADGGCSDVVKFLTK